MIVEQPDGRFKALHESDRRRRLVRAGGEPQKIYRHGQSTPSEVAILVDGSTAYGHGVLLGVHDYLTSASSPQWITFLPAYNSGLQQLRALTSWRGDGIIACTENRATPSMLEKLRLPTVDVGSSLAVPVFPRVCVDDALIGELAASHFQELRFLNVAFVGDRRFAWSRNRERAFAEHAVARGLCLEVFEHRGKGRRTGAEQAEAMVKWLHSLPKPVAVFACQDALAAQVLDACRRQNIRVPEDVAVLGVDNDEIRCQFASPTLSSIVPNARGAGRLAAGLLDHLMAGGEVPRDTRLPPLRVAVRQSTDIVAVEDPLVVQAATYIRHNAHRGINVSDVVEATMASRRSLEQRFLRHLNRSPHDEIVRVQFHIIESLLRDSDMKITAIARKAGFRHPEYMTVAFTKRHGMSPSEWRRKNRPLDGRTHR